MNLKKPNLPQVSSPPELLSQMVDTYTAIVELDGVRSPSKLPGLKAITAATVAALRKTPGDVLGERGPNAALLAGGSTVLDGSEGVFAWDQTSTTADNGSTVINPMGASPGRWRRMVWGGINLSLTLFTSLLPGIVPASGGGTANFLRADGSWAAPAAAGRVLRISTLASGTTLAAAAGCTLAWARIWAGGGGGGGASSAVTGYAAGGSAGGYAELVTPSIPATWNYAIGAAGAAGSSAGGNGGAGGVSTLQDGAVTVTANGGPGGLGDTIGTANTIGPSPPAVSTNGTTNGSGEPGGYAILGSWTGRGGSSSIGAGGRSVTSAAGTAASGLAAIGSASGGSGGASNAVLGATGGAGSAGRIILVEFS